MPSRATPLTPLLGESGVREPDPSLLTRVNVGIGKGVEGAAKADEDFGARAGQSADVYAIKRLLPLRPSQTSAGLSSPLRTAATAPPTTLGKLSSIACRSLNPGLTAEAPRRRTYVSRGSPLTFAAIDLYILEIVLAADSGVPLLFLASRLQVGTSEVPTRPWLTTTAMRTLGVCVSEFLLSPMLADTYTPVGTGPGEVREGPRMAMEAEREGIEMVREMDRAEDGVGSLGSWEGVFRAPDTSRHAAPLSTSLVVTTMLTHADTIVHQHASSPFSSRSERVQ